jgi:hypothetical protein
LGFLPTLITLMPASSVERPFYRTAVRSIVLSIE